MTQVGRQHEFKKKRFSVMNLKFLRGSNILKKKGSMDGWINDEARMLGGGLVKWIDSYLIGREQRIRPGSLLKLGDGEKWGPSILGAGTTSVSDLHKRGGSIPVFADDAKNMKVQSNELRNITKRQRRGEEVVVQMPNET